MIKRLIFTLLLLTLVFGGIFGWKYRQMQTMASQMSQPQPPATISSTRVQSEVWQPTLEAVGSLVAVQGIDVTTEVAGTVSSIEFESGESVDAGQVLLKLEDSVDQATLLGLVAQRRLAEVQFQRAAELLPERIMSKSDYDSAKAGFDAAKAKVVEQQAIIAKKTIRAPFRGALGLRKVDLGEYLTPGTSIVSLQTLDPIYVDYALPERYVREIAPGQAVSVRVDAFPGATFTGLVEATGSGVDTGTRSIQVRAKLPNSEAQLLPGMFAEIDTIQPLKRQVLTVPRTAVSFNTYGDFVYAIETAEGEGQIARRRQVVTGASRGGRVAVEKGLEAGVEIVQSGLVKLRDGQPVRVDNSIVLSDGEVPAE